MIKIRHLSKEFGSQVAVREIDLDIPAGHAERDPAVVVATSPPSVGLDTEHVAPKTQGIVWPAESPAMTIM